MTRRAYLYFAVTFILGVLVGGAGVLYYGWHTGDWHRRFNKNRIVRHMTRELGLNPSQVDQVNHIMDESIQKFRSLQDQTRPQFEAIHRETQDRIRQILTPEQVAKFNERVRRIEEMRKRHGPPDAR